MRFILSSGELFTLPALSLCWLSFELRLVGCKCQCYSLKIPCRVTHYGLFFSECWCCVGKRLQQRQNAGRNTRTWSTKPSRCSPWMAILKTYQMHRPSQFMLKATLHQFSLPDDKATIIHCRWLEDRLQIPKAFLRADRKLVLSLRVGFRRWNITASVSEHSKRSWRIILWDAGNKHVCKCPQLLDEARRCLYRFCRGSLTRQNFLLPSKFPYVGTCAWDQYRLEYPS